jgi:hypothetical protein
LNRASRYTLPELLIGKTHLSWYTAIGMIALLLLSGLIITALVAQTPFSQLGWKFWRVGLQGPAIIIYILIIYPILTKIGDNAIDSITPWVDLSREEVAKLDAKYRIPSRYGEYLSFSAGVIFILILTQPWRGVFTSTNIFLFITEIIMFGLLGLLIYYGFRNAKYITLINRNLKLDLFDLDALAN